MSRRSGWLWRGGEGDGQEAQGILSLQMNLGGKGWEREGPWQGCPSLGFAVNMGLRQTQGLF